jgi:hypothetical protein
MFVKSRKKHLLSLILILILLFPFNLKQNYLGFLKNREAHLFLNRVLTSMKDTGKQYWRGDYWTAYLLTALSKENIIVDSTTVNRYYPYKLSYYNESQSENFIFLRGPHSFEGRLATRFIDMLDVLNIEFEKEKIGDGWLIYDVKYPVFERFFNAPIPSQIPNLVLSQVSSLKGHLYLNFQNKEIGKDLEYRVNVEIPGYSSVSRRFTSDSKEMNVRIPFPRKKYFKIRYYMEYQRLKIKSTVRELSYYPSDDELKERRKIVYLTGFRPAVDIQGKKMRVCEKVVKIEINNIFQRRVNKIQLYLYSPFEFFHPWWYGDNFQKVRIEINGSYFADKILKDGNNVVEIGGNSKNSPLEKGTNTITLRFKYHLFFNFAPLWRTSALLEKVKIE